MLSICGKRLGINSQESQSSLSTPGKEAELKGQGCREHLECLLNKLRILQIATQILTDLTVAQYPFSTQIMQTLLSTAQNMYHVHVRKVLIM